MAVARAARTPVDAHGRPKGEPGRLTYDDRGILVAAEAAPERVSPMGGLRREAWLPAAQLDQA